MNCPEPEILEQYYRGTYTGPEPIKPHVEQCDRCRSAMDTLHLAVTLRQNGTIPSRGVTVQGSLAAMGLIEELSVEPEQGPAPARLGDYEILEVLGRGGMGVVYLARQTTLNRLVALKTVVAALHSDPGLVDRFKTEAEAAARLEHPGIVPVYEINDQGTLLYYSMAYVEGESLSERLRRNTLDAEEGATLVRDLADALSHAHAEGVIHRDLKPANVMLDEQSKPRITDFGLAKISDGEQLTMTGAVMGTPSYMAPEQARGDGDLIDETTDVYALGAILYGCLAGHAPFQGPTPVATLDLVINAEAPALKEIAPNVPADLETIVAKCLSKEQSSRYASARELHDELQRYLEGKPILARPVSNWTKLNRWRRRNPAIATLLFLLTTSLGAGFAVSGYFAYLANERAERAENGFRAATEQSNLALNSLRTVIYNVQNQLKEIPEARAVRRSVLKEVLADLEKISTKYIEQNLVDRDSAFVFAQLGQLYLEIGDDAGADSVSLSEKNYLKAIEILEVLVERNPTDDSLVASLIEHAREHGDNVREYRLFDKAIRAHRKARDYAIRWLDRSPENYAAQVAYIETTEALGEALIRNAAYEESKPLCLEAAQLAEENAQKNPSMKAIEIMGLCYTTVGDLYRKTRELDKAEAAYRKMSDATKALLQNDPGNPEYTNYLSSDYERLGDLHMVRKQYKEARECYEAELRIWKSLVEKDPANLHMWKQGTWPYEKLADVYTMQGEPERAEWAKQKLKEIYVKLRADKSSQP